MRFKKPVKHLLGNMITAHGVTVEGKSVIFYKAVYQQNDKPKYYALYWDKDRENRPKYEVGKTYRKNIDWNLGKQHWLGLFLGTFMHVIKHYYVFNYYKLTYRRRILKCSVPIAAITFKSNRQESYDRVNDPNYPNFTTDWFECNRFTVLEDVTDKLYGTYEQFCRTFS